MDLRPATANESGQKVYLTISSALVSAVLEWILMFMILLDAGFSFFITRFAHYCQLQIPCLFCSRLDHVLGNERASFYWDLICHNHKSKISALVFCPLHNNLVDVHETCENCLFSFATIKKSNKLGADDYNLGSSVAGKCTCCNEQWISKTRTKKLFHIKSIDSKGADIDAPSSITPKYDGDDADHVEYKQIKVTSDTESEDPSDNENANVLIREIEISGKDPTAEDVSPEPQIINLAACPASEKLIHPAPPITSSLSGTVGPTNSQHIVESKMPIGHGLEEIKWQQADCHNNDFSEQSLLVSFPEALPSSNVNGSHYDESKEINATSTTEFEKDVHVGSGSIAANEIQMDLKHNKTDSSSLDLCDAYKLALGARSRQLSGRFLEQQKSMTESTKASEDLKLLLSQISAARGFELSDVSPRVSATSEDFKAIDPSAAIGMQIFQRRISLERNESNLSLDGSTISEIEGESVVDRLKRQAEHDKKIKGSLYKELEEERNASAIAANQAMAMITRLQEEKAALNMEALQCLRMMEEQAEYDDEALQKANDLLLEKEKQIQELEFELELYRSRFGDITRLESDADELKVEKNMTVFSGSDNDRS